MQRALLLCVFVLLLGCEAPEAPVDDNPAAVSDLKDDESLVFFRTAAWLNVATQEWHVPIHGWIYEPEDSSARKALAETILNEQFDLTPTAGTEANFTRRLNLLLADNERGKEIVIRLAGRDYSLPTSAENGHFEATLVIAIEDLQSAKAGNLLRYSAVLPDDEKRGFSGEVVLLPPQGVSIISDIDDTVKITHVIDRKRMIEHTFLLDFVAAPGMAELYQGWSDENVSFHFVSSSPWQLYTPLSEFLDSHGFPWSTYNLKAVRFRDETLFDLFKKGTETKPATIEKLLSAYPARKFVLVGDSGEQDPEVYAALMKRHPEQILRVYIRNVTQETADNARFQTQFENIDADRWQLFDDPTTLRLSDHR